MNPATSSPITLIKERLHVIVGTVLGLAAAVGIGLFAVGYGGNPIKSLMLILGGITMIVATLRPKVGLYMLILSSAFLDLIKRLLLTFGVSSTSDVAGVLATAPMILIGTFLGACVLHPIFTKRMLDKTGRRLALGALGLIGIAIAVGFRQATSIVELLGTVANQVAYALLLPVVYVLYRGKGIQEFEKLLRFSALAYIPVAIYGIFQFWFGYSRFEIEYLSSGLTITAINLYDIHPRPFSTLNSPHAYSTLMWFMTVCCIGLGFQLRGENRTPRWLPLLYISSLLLSFVRGAIVLAAINLLMGRWFKTRKGTITFYCIALTAGTFLIGFSEFLLDRLDWFQTFLPGGSDWQQVAFRLGTISDRLQGYQSVLLNPKMYTAFGHGVSNEVMKFTFEEEGFNHDVLSSTLFRFGVVGLVMLLSFCGFILWRIHSAVWRVQDREKKALGTTLVSIFVLILMSHIGGPSYHVFPINLFIWLFLGLTIMVCNVSEENGGEVPKATGADELRRPLRAGGKTIGARGMP